MPSTERQFKAEIAFTRDDEFFLDEDEIKWIKPILVQALPQMTNLQIVQLENLGCDDQMLEQLAMHLNSLV